MSQAPQPDPKANNLRDKSTKSMKSDGRMQLSIEFHYKALMLYPKLTTPSICERNSKNQQGGFGSSVITKPEWGHRTSIGNHPKHLFFNATCRLLIFLSKLQPVLLLSRACDQMKGLQLRPQMRCDLAPKNDLHNFKRPTTQHFAVTNSLSLQSFIIKS